MARTHLAQSWMFTGGSRLKCVLRAVCIHTSSNQVKVLSKVLLSRCHSTTSACLGSGKYLTMKMKLIVDLRPSHMRANVPAATLN